MINPAYFRQVEYTPANDKVLGQDLTLPWAGHQTRCGDRCKEFVCTLINGHGGIHMGGTNSGRWVAEWTDYPKAMQYPGGI